MITSFSAADVVRACTVWGKDLKRIPERLDPVQLMWAFANKESTHEKPGFFGCIPRFEPAYFTGGRYADNDEMSILLAAFGRDAACSYGPWQVMLVNAPARRPKDFEHIDICAEAFVEFLNRQKKRPQTLAEFGQLYNGGHIVEAPNQPLPQVAKYSAELVKCYAIPIPTL